MEWWVPSSSDARDPATCDEYLGGEGPLRSAFTRASFVLCRANFSKLGRLLLSCAAAPRQEAGTVFDSEL